MTSTVVNNDSTAESLKYIKNTSMQLNTSYIARHNLAGLLLTERVYLPPTEYAFSILVVFCIQLETSISSSQ